MPTAANFPLPAARCPLPAARCPLPAARCKPPFQEPTAESREPTASVTEMPPPREHHRDPAVVGCGDYFVVANAAAGLDACGRAGIGGGHEAVGEREEGVRRD